MTRTRLGMLAAAVVTVFGPVALPAVAGGASTAPVVRSTASLPTLPPGSRAVGATPDAEQLTVDIALQPRDRAGLDAMAAAVAEPSSPEFRHFLTAPEFASRFGADPTTVAAVRAWLAGAGLQAGPTATDGLLVPVHATVAQLRGAFGVGFERYRLP
ncbi:MAG TPA: protease pro-enzyme activation domain-containing protein, partial [Acidimicrobiales bacterium]|nr:protease pro-enzyme activation domain-containing protein [Acidimicrobiales bacterium]